MSGQPGGSAVRRVADLAAEWFGSAYGLTAAAVRGVALLGRDRSVLVVGRDGASATLRLHASTLQGMDTIGSQLLSGSYETTTRRVLEMVVAPGSTVVDVGANVGYFTMLAALLTGPTGRVVAFEPEPRNHALLVANVAENKLDQVHVIRAACADRVGTHELAVNTAESGWHRLVAADGSSNGLKRVPVTLTTVDAVLGDARVDVVKIDVEGHEGSVLAGMARTLAANPGVTVILEHSPAQARLAGLDPAAPLHQLAEAGLRHAYLVREDDAVLEEVDAEQLGSRSTKTGRSINLVVRAQPWPADAAVRAVARPAR
ncbi:MAG: FkbM family methyltransferase [Actinomycetales bacterium]|nr:FkbM family methyltransferase [Actinomycetales bacterium]